MTTENWIDWKPGMKPLSPDEFVEVKLDEKYELKLREQGVIPLTYGKAGEFCWSGGLILGYRFAKRSDRPSTSEYAVRQYTRADILDHAKELVCTEREQTHGRPEETFLAIAEYWTVYLAHPVSPADVCNMMALLKIARSQKNPANRDNQVDGAGYMALAGELLERTTP